MKILHFIPTYKPAFVYGGPVFSVSRLCENLAAAGHEVTVLATTANGKNELDVPVSRAVWVDGVRVFYFPRYTKDHTHLSPGIIIQLWKDCRQYDVVHIHSWWNIPVMAAVLVCWLRGVRPVLSPRGTLSDFSFQKRLFSPRVWFHHLIGRFLLRKTVFHLTTEAEQDISRRTNPVGFVLPNFIELDPTDQHPLPHNQVFTLAFLSRIHPVKNLENLLSALTRTDPDLHLRIAGNGEADYLNKLKELAVALGLESRIEWVGSLHGTEKFKFYAAADLFVLPSLTENFANVVIESLSAGTPVLVSENVGIAGYVRKHQLGWTCGTDAGSIANAIGYIRSLPEEETVVLRRKVQLQVRKDFSETSLIEKYVEAYNNVAYLAQKSR